MRYRVITAILARLFRRQHPCSGGRHGTGGSLPWLDAGKGPRRLTGRNSYALGAVSGAARARYRPGWVSGRRHPCRCGEMSEAKASPARAPPRHGRLRRPEPHRQPHPGTGAIFLCRYRAQLIPTTVGAGRPVPHRQNYVGGYVFSQRLSGRPGSNRATLEAGPALPVRHSIRIFAGDVSALPSSVSMPRAIVGGMLRHGWVPESGEGE